MFQIAIVTVLGLILMAVIPIAAIVMIITEKHRKSGLILLVVFLAVTAGLYVNTLLP